MHPTLLRRLRRKLSSFEHNSENRHILTWPWQDVDRLKDLLIGEAVSVGEIIPCSRVTLQQEKYGYDADDIILMTDRRKVVERLRPTYDNIASTFGVLRISCG